MSWAFFYGSDVLLTKHLGSVGAGLPANDMNAAPDHSRASPPLRGQALLHVGSMKGEVTREHLIRAI